MESLRVFPESHVYVLGVKEKEKLLFGGGVKMAVQYAYIRVSTVEQNEARQLEAIKNFCPNIPLENIFIDKITGKQYDRPNYLAMKQLILNVQRAYSSSGMLRSLK